MSDHEKQLDKEELAKSNLWTAVVLGAIAFIVAIMPFFYLRNLG